MVTTITTHHSKAHSLARESREGEFLSKPQGAPRGLLVYYILRRVSEKPTHGYDLLRDIESKTEGAWRPGPGSIYPHLKKLASKGYIKSEPSDSKRSNETSQHTYRITPKGVEYLAEAKDWFAHMGQRWTSMRRIFIDLIGPEHTAKFFTEGTRTSFEMAREMLDSKMSLLSKEEVEYILKEYALSLERQLRWSQDTLKNLQKSKGGGRREEMTFVVGERVR
jgi:DNA-binding PadR family transcriptional regulator